MHRRALLGAALAAGLPHVGNTAAKLAVLELFTSQSCSSCPPADALLGKLAQRPDVIALAWHVDYWNNLGWLDKFSSHQATTRQQAYSTQIGVEVFTPALVIDGASVVVGSDQAAIERAVATALPLTVPVTLSRGTNTLAVDIGRGSARLRAISVIYDPEHSTEVGAGENDGAQLREYQIVREVEVLGEWDGSPRHFTARQSSLTQGQVILVHAADLRVVGAAKQPPTEHSRQPP